VHPWAHAERPLGVLDLVWVLVRDAHDGGHGRRVRAVARRRGRDGAADGFVLLVAHVGRLADARAGESEVRSRLALKIDEFLQRDAARRMCSTGADGV